MGNLFSSDPPRARRIKINVYRLNTDSRLVQTAEAMFGAKMYHSGVEIDGVEYAFGAGGGLGPRRATGVWAQPPRKPMVVGAKFAKTIVMGLSAPFSLEEFVREVSAAPEWQRSEYDMLTRNCHHFTAAVCAHVGVGAPPAWLNALAEAAEKAARKSESPLADLMCGRGTEDGLDGVEDFDVADFKSGGTTQSARETTAKSIRAAARRDFQMTEVEEGDTSVFSCICGVPECYDPGEPQRRPPVPGARAIMAGSHEQGRSRPVVAFVP